ncbi:hypothetical protein HMPREF1981_01437 [Bacteroides pyogenes F0041]|uniref:Uncharacterized protein n=1 Tax=Bacteroides pyogenes F0041 TaxID=1321819 RepID=U2CNU0_9BACE|nr:hypothetical protein [Bacteroides pyogenes]ERI85713.1 hypothetical protein HMPREF1981_01437 [Bacteroides pyogenes F0041]MBB3893798.1 hypothetical protein [Bacteroides pyogenes]GAE21493.1 hypothetical protein JCM10003_953 [Bacteroides pyogenes JCM 10003]SUV33749.1 Uncharacterised protein [Bacteroides pyogenes]
MKKIFSFLTLTALIVFASCSKENIVSTDNDVVAPGSEQILTVQGHPYEVSKSQVKNIKKSSRSVMISLNGGDPGFSMDDIQFWAGTGTNKAAMVIEWHDGKTSDALVWGYKWNGTAYGFDMIREIVKADPRLIFLTHMTGPMGNTIAGLGYNINQTGAHYLIYDEDSTNPHYPIDGIVVTNAYNYDNWRYSDPADHWRSGWYQGYWSYWVKDSKEEEWQYSNWGASSRELVNGSWDGWSYLDDMSIWTGRPLGNKFTPAALN